MIRSRATTLIAMDTMFAEQTAWAVRSALGYWEAGHVGLNARVLSRYYALLQISIAEQVASPDSTSDFQEVQRHTEAGHGLSTLSGPDGKFPGNYYVGCSKRGHFYEHQGINLERFAFGGRPTGFPSAKPDQIARLVSLADLFARIPELQTTIDEYLDVSPLSFHVGHASRNMEQQIKTAQAHVRKTGELTFNPPSGEAVKTSYVAIYPQSEKVTIDYLSSLGLPFTDPEVEIYPVSGMKYFVGKLVHSADKHWHESVDLYKSGSYIVPLWGTVRDSFILHFIILYSLSIVVRYLPSLRHDIEDGALNHIRALIEHYLAIIDHVLPRLAIERITGRRLSIAQPARSMDRSNMLP
jgi:hypothetical protein